MEGMGCDIWRSFDEWPGGKLAGWSNCSWEGTVDIVAECAFDRWLVKVQVGRLICWFIRRVFSWFVRKYFFNGYSVGKWDGRFNVVPEGVFDGLSERMVSFAKTRDSWAQRGLSLRFLQRIVSASSRIFSDKQDRHHSWSIWSFLWQECPWKGTSAVLHCNPWQRLRQWDSPDLHEGTQKWRQASECQWHLSSLSVSIPDWLAMELGESWDERLLRFCAVVEMLVTLLGFASAVHTCLNLQTCCLSDINRQKIFTIPKFELRDKTEIHWKTFQNPFFSRRKTIFDESNLNQSLDSYFIAESESNLIQLSLQHECRCNWLFARHWTQQFNSCKLIYCKFKNKRNWLSIDQKILQFPTQMNGSFAFFWTRFWISASMIPI